MRISFVPCFALAALSLLACREDDDVSTAPAGPETPAIAATVASLQFRQISGGGGHTCAVTTADKAYCWGDNRDGQLGDGTTTDRLLPVAVAGGHTFRHLSGGGGHTCGVTTDDRLLCWGANNIGQLGDGTTSRRTRPVPIGGTRHFQQVEAGLNHTCALDAATQKAFCWGSNSNGQLGIGTAAARRLQPAAVAGGRRFRMVSAGGWHTCAVTPSDAAYCWGDNSNGALGDGTRTRRSAPAAVTGGQGFRQVSTGLAHTCAATPGGKAFCWGFNEEGQVGDGSTARRLAPSAVAGGLTFTRVTAGYSQSCGEASRRAYCWGDNVYGQLGVGDLPVDRELVPTAVAGNLLFAQVNASTTSNETCGVTTGSAAYCWGANYQGNLGDGSTTNRTAPVRVGGG